MIKNRFLKNRHGQLMQNPILHNPCIFYKSSPIMTNRKDEDEKNNNNPPHVIQKISNQNPQN